MELYEKKVSCISSISFIIRLYCISCISCMELCVKLLLRMELNPKKAWTRSFGMKLFQYNAITHSIRKNNERNTLPSRLERKTCCQLKNKTTVLYVRVNRKVLPNRYPSVTDINAKHQFS